MKSSVLLRSASILFLLVLFQSGCKTVCDSIPTERAPKLRIVNAMPDELALKIYIGNRLVNAAYPYDLPADFGYTDKYSDGSFLRIGVRQPLDVLSESQDTLIKDSITLSEHRHTLFILGRGLPALASTRRIILYDDEINQPDPNTNLVRFVHALTDLPALDVYFSSKIKDSTPAFSIKYGDTVNLYRPLAGAKGLTVTAAGDPNHIIFSTSLPFQSSGFFVTILLRGETKQYGMDPLVSLNILSDISQGGSISAISTLGVRSIIATRGTDYLALMPHGPLDKGPRVDVAGQSILLSIPRDSVTDWAPFNPINHGGGPGVPVSWDFGHFNYPIVDTVFIFNFVASANVRYSFVLLDKATLASGNVSLDTMILTDTIAAPAAGMGRLRIVNFSPDHVVSFTIAGKSVTLSQKGIALIDVPPGHYTPTETSTNTQLDITVPASIPEGVFFFPSISSNPLPYKIAKE
jgi:hypothetical protein